MSGETGSDTDSTGISLSRRSLFMAGVATVAIGGLIASTRESQARLVDIGQAKRTIVGYAWPWTARPGEKVTFHVSTYAPGDYQAELVRLICADAITDNGKHYKEEVVQAAFAKTYPGRHQPVYTGNCVDIPNTHALDGAGSFTLVASICPTSVKRGTELSGAGFSAASLGRTPQAPHPQHLICRWHAPTKTGWSLALDEKDCVAFLVGDGSGTISKVALPTPVALKRWVRIGVAYDAATGQVRLTQSPAIEGAGDRLWRQPEQVSGAIQSPPQTSPLRMGAAVGLPGNAATARCSDAYNGKIDNVRMVRGALDDDAVRKLHDASAPADVSARPIAWWDFAKGIGTVQVHDISGNGMDGTTVNLPERAVVGVRWNGSQFDWRTAPAHYSAMYFHDSAMIDAEWKPDFEFEVPSGLKSGIYAAHLRHGASEDYIPFYVAPPRNAPKAKLALIIPTLTYLAYQNASGVSLWTRKVVVTDKQGHTQVKEEEWMPISLEDKSAVEFLFEHFYEFGMGVYRFHSDGSPVRQASMHAPNISDRAKAFRRHLTADTDIIEWLEHDGVQYDVITDDLLEKEGADLLSGYTCVMTGQHSEYLTWKMRGAYAAYLDGGGRLMSVGGNMFHNRIAFHSQIPGVIECRKKMGGTTSVEDLNYECFSEFDGLPMSKFREIGAPANTLHGLGMTDLEPMDKGTYYKRLPPSKDARAHFIFAGVGYDEKIGDFGKAGGGACAEEIEHSDYMHGTPGHALVLARSEDMKWPLVSEDGLTEPKYRINFDPHANLIFYETPNGGAVFAVGSMGWRGALYYNDFNNNVARIMRNVLARFTDSTPFKYPA